MISKQHTAPIYRPHANHWLRMIFAGMSRLRCIRECEGVVSQTTVDMTVAPSNAHGVITGTTWPLMVDTTDVTGTGLASVRIYARVFPDPTTSTLQIFKDPARTIMVAWWESMTSNDEVAFGYAGNAYPGLVNIDGVVSNIMSVGDGQADFEIRIEGDVPLPPPAEAVPEDPLNRSALLSNEGDVPLLVKEADKALMLLGPGKSAEWPTAAYFGLTVEIAPRTVIQAGQTALLRVTRTQRCLCGDVIVVPVPEPEGGDLV